MRNFAKCAVACLFTAVFATAAAHAQDPIDPTIAEEEGVFAGHTNFNGELAMVPYASSIFCDEPDPTLYVHPEYFDEALGRLDAVEVGDNLYALPDGRLVSPEVSSFVIADLGGLDSGPVPTLDSEPIPVPPPLDGDPIGGLPLVGISDLSIASLPITCAINVKHWKCVDGTCDNNCKGYRKYYRGPKAFCFCIWSDTATDECDKRTKSVTCKWKDYSESPCKGEVMASGTWKGYTRKK